MDRILEGLCFFFFSPCGASNQPVEVARCVDDHFKNTFSLR